MKFHLVCHDCEAEGVEDSKTLADRLAEMHRDRKGHDVEVEAVEEAGHDV